MITKLSCSVCGAELQPLTPEAEAEALQELKENFGEAFRLEDCDRVCDDCYPKVMAWQAKSLNQN